MQQTTAALGDRSNDIDIPTIVHTAVAIPQQVANLERAMIACAIVLAVVGIINAILLAGMLRTRAQLLAAAAPPSAPEPRAIAALGVMPPDTSTGTCACGTLISPRSKTGRCRSCALDLRMQQRAQQN